jgi:hypothetical protein
MKDESIKAFLEQFETSRKNVNEWPHWMRESAIIATASFPKSHQSIESKKGNQPPLKEDD